MPGAAFDPAKHLKGGPGSKGPPGTKAAGTHTGPEGEESHCVPTPSNLLCKTHSSLNFKKPGSLGTMAHIQNANKTPGSKGHTSPRRNPFNAKTQCWCIVPQRRPEPATAAAWGRQEHSVTGSSIMKRPIKNSVNPHSPMLGKCSLAAPPTLPPP